MGKLGFRRELSYTYMIDIRVVFIYKNKKACTFKNIKGWFRIYA